MPIFVLNFFILINGESHEIFERKKKFSYMGRVRHRLIQNRLTATAAEDHA